LAEVVEHLPRMLEAVSSIPSTALKKKKNPGLKEWLKE
jgi:hypothetical protein